MYNLIIIYKKGTDLFSHIEYFDETARNIFFKSGNTCIFNSTILSLFISRLNCIFINHSSAVANGIA